MTSKRKPGRPQKPIDAKLVRSLAELQCTNVEIASVCECDEKTIRSRFSEQVRQGREIGKTSLRRAQFKHALAGNSRLLIFLGKQYLGQSEKLDTTLSESWQPPPFETFVRDPALLERAMQLERDIADAQQEIQLGDRFEGRERSYMDRRGNGKPQDPDME